MKSRDAWQSDTIPRCQWPSLALLFAAYTNMKKITSPEFVGDSDDLDGMEVDSDEDESLSSGSSDGELPK